MQKTLLILENVLCYNIHKLIKMERFTTRRFCNDRKTKKKRKEIDIRLGHAIDPRNTFLRIFLIREHRFHSNGVSRTTRKRVFVGAGELHQIFQGVSESEQRASVCIEKYDDILLHERGRRAAVIRGHLLLYL